jgi:hypothetical protein
VRASAGALRQLQLVRLRRPQPQTSGTDFPYAASFNRRSQLKRAKPQRTRGRTPNWVKVKTKHGRHIDEESAKWNE